MGVSSTPLLPLSALLTLLHWFSFIPLTNHAPSYDRAPFLYLDALSSTSALIGLSHPLNLTPCPYPLKIFSPFIHILSQSFTGFLHILIYLYFITYQIFYFHTCFYQSLPLIRRATMGIIFYLYTIAFPVPNKE